MKLNKRKLTICHSSNPSEYHVRLHSSLPCNVIYSKDYQNGTLYALVLSKQKFVGTMDSKISQLDEFLKKKDGETSTKFTSISDVLSGKIKTFGIGGHDFDEHYNAIFISGAHSGRRELTVHPDVKAWYPQDHGIQNIEAECTEDAVNEADATDPSNCRKRAANEDQGQPKKMKLTLGDGNPGSVVDEIINKEQDIEHHLVSELKQLQQEAEDLKSKLATSKDETSSYKKSAEFYETQYNDYKDQMEDAGVVGSTEYYKTKAEDLEKKFNGLDGSEVEKFKELNTNYNRELEFAEQREGEIFDLKAKVLIGFILVHTLELTTPFRWGG